MASDAGEDDNKILWELAAANWNILCSLELLWGEPWSSFAGCELLLTPAD